jgi:hypothetical protein
MDSGLAGGLRPGLTVINAISHPYRSKARLIRAQSSIARSSPGVIAITIWFQPAPRKASTRCFNSCSLAVKVVRRISSAVTNLRSSGLTKEMTAVIRQIARIGRLVTARHLDIAGNFGGNILRHRRRILPAFHVEVGRPVQQNGGARPGLRHGARAVARLALGEHAAAGPSSGIKIARGAASRFPAFLHAFERLQRARNAGDKALPTCV